MRLGIKVLLHGFNLPFFLLNHLLLANLLLSQAALSTVLKHHVPIGSVSGLHIVGVVNDIKGYIDAHDFAKVDIVPGGKFI